MYFLQIILRLLNVKETKAQEALHPVCFRSRSNLSIILGCCFQAYCACVYILQKCLVRKIINYIPTVIIRLMSTLHWTDIMGKKKPTCSMPFWFTDFFLKPAFNVLINIFPTEQGFKWKHWTHSWVKHQQPTFISHFYSEKCRKKTDEFSLKVGTIYQAVPEEKQNRNQNLSSQ